GDLFFFSSRRRHTRFSRDWSSDVCSSDLAAVDPLELRRGMVDAVDLLQFLDVHAAAARVRVEAGRDAPVGGAEFIDAAAGPDARSEERRVGKEGRSAWSAYDQEHNTARMR